MAYEIELKYLAQNCTVLRDTLQRLGAKVHSSRHWERNVVLDTAAQDLRKSKTVLRLRRNIWAEEESPVAGNTACPAQKEESVLTVKCPPQAKQNAVTSLAAGIAENAGASLPPSASSLPSDVKIREEYETRIENYHAMLSALSALGYTPTFGYDKIREEWCLDGVIVCLDTLRLGNSIVDIVELEGQREAIFALAARLSIENAPTSTESYYALNNKERERQNLPQQDSFLFANDAEALTVLHAKKFA